MNLLTDKIRSVYFKYLAAAFGSALISSIYGLVDTAMVGQYQGPEGTAALAIVAPVWNIIYSLGLLTGIGGSVLLPPKQSLQEASLMFLEIIFLSSFLIWGSWEPDLLQLSGQESPLRLC